MVGSTHVDAMVTAGLVLVRPYGPLRWAARDLTDEEDERYYQRGEPWGPGITDIYGEVFRELVEESAGRVGAMLLAENRRSVNHRYDEEEWEEPYGFRRLAGYPDPIVVLKAISCYRYQSCEHPAWPDSEAFRFCEALESVAIARLPGYDEAPGWEVHDRNVFTARTVRS